jgi:hypothetical protein
VIEKATAVLLLGRVEKSGRYFGLGVGVGRWTETRGVLLGWGMVFLILCFRLWRAWLSTVFALLIFLWNLALESHISLDAYKWCYKDSI